MRSCQLAVAIQRLRLSADSNDWHERECAGFSLRDLIEESFEEGIRLTRDWVKDPSERIRRAACLACMQRKKYTTPHRLGIVLRRLGPIMTDDSLYVRKCCGPFVVGYLGYTYPEMTLPWLSNQATRRDLNVRTNVAKAFSQALGGRHPREALEILNSLSDDERPRVRAASKSAVKNVLRRSFDARDLITSRFPGLLRVIGGDL
jgi:3-methyladenine DNA glycosylase AlkC